MTTLILNHLLPFALITALILVAVLAYGVGLSRGQNLTGSKSWPKGRPVVSLDWIETTPVAIIESDPATAADVAAWLDAVKEGAVLRV